MHLLTDILSTLFRSHYCITAVKPQKNYLLSKFTMPPVSKDNREFDVIVWGATGFTGQLAAEYLATSYRRSTESCAVPMDGKTKPQPSAKGEQSVNFALGGRNLEKLKKVRNAIAKMNPECEQLPLVVGDALDFKQMTVVASRTRAIMSMAGPFMLYGENLVRACAEQGTDYVDITGETYWSRQMIDKYEKTAKRNNSLIVSLCGYDSTPSDITTMATVNYIKEMGEEPGRVRGLHKAAGGVSGGTIASAMNIFKLPFAELKKMANPFQLVDKDVRPKKRDSRDRPSMFIGYDDDAKVRTMPFVMAAVNSQVVRRSASQLGYGDSFGYNEVMVAKNAVIGLITSLVLMLLPLFLLFSPGRWLLSKVLPAPGQGPSRETMERGYLHLTNIGETTSGKKVRTVWKSCEVGYFGTARMLTECALCSVFHRNQLPKGGFYTPASAFGRVLIPRLARFGVSIETQEM
jgi:short subunit dehydrogenase-like uncharacterized protein